MPQRLIKDRVVVDDRWTLLRDVSSETLPAGPVIVSLPVWKSRRDALAARGDVGVWLAAADDPAELAADTASLALIAVDFPQFTDGRGYSIGRLLRERYGFAGELRAIGDVQRDLIVQPRRCA